jgi:hypothetical protein
MTTTTATNVPDFTTSYFSLDGLRTLQQEVDDAKNLRYGDRGAIPFTRNNDGWQSQIDEAGKTIRELFQKDTSGTPQQQIDRVLSQNLSSIDPLAEDARQFIVRFTSSGAENSLAERLYNAALQMRIDPTSDTNKQLLSGLLGELSNTFDLQSLGEDSYLRKMFTEWGIDLINPQNLENINIPKIVQSIDNLATPSGVQSLLRQAVRFGYADELAEYSVTMSRNLGLNHGSFNRGIQGYLAKKLLDTLGFATSIVPERWRTGLFEFFTGGSLEKADQIALARMGQVSADNLRSAASVLDIPRILRDNVIDSIAPALKTFVSGIRIPLLTSAVSLGLDGEFRNNVVQTFTKAMRMDFRGALGHAGKVIYEVGKNLTADFVTLLATTAIGAAGFLAGGPLGVIAAIALSTAINTGTQMAIDGFAGAVTNVANNSHSPTVPGAAPQFDISTAPPDIANLLNQANALTGGGNSPSSTPVP